uniref:DUF834 domain-containing protein n=1 Tax=Oryza meridionalis TaxID=40149 RepID=A0A0E0E0K6_9ORYZ
MAAQAKMETTVASKGKEWQGGTVAMTGAAWTSDCGWWSMRRRGVDEEQRRRPGRRRSDRHSLGFLQGACRRQIGWTVTAVGPGIDTVLCMVRGGSTRRRMTDGLVQGV